MKTHLILLLLLTVNFCISFNANAEPTPRWVKKGVKELNQKRTNDSYSFHIFHHEDVDRNRFEVDNFKSLLEYVDSVYDVDQSQIFVDSIPANGSLPTTYEVSFNKDGKENTVYAQLVDHYSKFEDYPNGEYDYNLYQLYAISEEGVNKPDFDKFALSRNYGAKPVLMSIIPGLGQIYKGQQAKGYAILGVEAAMVASIIYATTQVNKWNNLAYQNQGVFDYYQSKADTFRQWRAFCYIAGGALYIYNLLDAALYKGARYVEIERNNQPNAEMTFVPSFSPEFLGLNININF